MKKIYFGRLFVVFLENVFYNHGNTLIRCIEKDCSKCRRTAKGEEIQ